MCICLPDCSGRAKTQQSTTPSLPIAPEVEVESQDQDEIPPKSMQSTVYSIAMDMVCSLIDITRPTSFVLYIMVIYVAFALLKEIGEWLMHAAPFTAMVSFIVLYGAVTIVIFHEEDLRRVWSESHNAWERALGLDQPLAKKNALASALGLDQQPATKEREAERKEELKVIPAVALAVALVLDPAYHPCATLQLPCHSHPPSVATWCVSGLGLAGSNADPLTLLARDTSRPRRRLSPS